MLAAASVSRPAVDVTGAVTPRRLGAEDFSVRRSALRGSAGGRSVLLAGDGVLKALASLEGGVLAGRDLDLLGGARFDTRAGLTLPDLERAEPGQRDLVALGDVVGHRAEQRVQRLLDGLLGESGAVGDLGDQLCFTDGLGSGHARAPFAKLARSIEHRGRD